MFVVYMGPPFMNFFSNSVIWLSLGLTPVDLFVFSLGSCGLEHQLAKYVRLLISMYV
jgi:hypothetical protein